MKFLVQFLLHCNHLYSQFDPIMTLHPSLLMNIPQTRDELDLADHYTNSQPKRYFRCEIITKERFNQDIFAVAHILLQTLILI